jgi:hypothetical protein
MFDNIGPWIELKFSFNASLKIKEAYKGGGSCFSLVVKWKKINAYFVKDHGFAARPWAKRAFNRSI